MNSRDFACAEAVTATLKDIEVKLGFVDGAQHVFLNGEDVSDAIRTPEASMGASNVSAIPAVRTFLFNLQRDIAKNNNCIMDGRDIGTQVIPNAEVKIFMTASVEQRALRRYSENLEKGYTSDLEQLKAEIIARDKADLERSVSPLRKADDAVELDTSDKSIEEIVKQILDIVQARKLN